MAYVDAQLLLSDAQALTATAASTNYINLSATERFIGTGDPMALVVTVDVAAGGTAPTLEVALQSDDNTAFSSATARATSGTLTAAQLVAGAQFVVAIPSGTATEKYLRAFYTVGGTAPTVTVSASVKPLSMVSNLHYHADAVTIS